MKVYVVMGNDFPDNVFADEANAQAYIDDKKREDLQRRGGFGPRIYWRFYEFEVRT